jgi:uncharacterized protein
MRLYEGIISEFNNAIVRNELADQISSNYEKYFHRGVNPAEYRSWQQSLNYLKNSFEYTGLLNNKIIIEYQLPYSTRRIDVLLFGRNDHQNESVVLMELKQWSNENVEDCPAEGNIIVDYGRFRKEQVHKVPVNLPAVNPIFSPCNPLSLRTNSHYMSYLFVWK